MFYVYMLHCRGGAYYTGHTDDLDARIAAHSVGEGCAFTADRLPVELVWSETFTTRADALELERRIKGWSRAKKMALIRGDFGSLHDLAKRKGGPSTGSGRTD